MNVNSFLGSAELALGRDQGRGCKHDDNAEDQESHRVRRRHDVAVGLVDCAVEAGMEDRHE